MHMRRQSRVPKAAMRNAAVLCEAYDYPEKVSEIEGIALTPRGRRA